MLHLFPQSPNIQLINYFNLFPKLTFSTRKIKVNNKKFSKKRNISNKQYKYKKKQNFEIKHFYETEQFAILKLERDQQRILESAIAELGRFKRRERASLHQGPLHYIIILNLRKIMFM